MRDAARPMLRHPQWHHASADGVSAAGLPLRVRGCVGPGSMVALVRRDARAWQGDTRANDRGASRDSRAIFARALRGSCACVNPYELGAWRSMVAHLPWEQGVGRSNRLAPMRAPVAQ
jgi:hypothetical protein